METTTGALLNAVAHTAHNILGGLPFCSDLDALAQHTTKAMNLHLCMLNTAASSHLCHDNHLILSESAPLVVALTTTGESCINIAFMEGLPHNMSRHLMTTVHNAVFLLP